MLVLNQFVSQELYRANVVLYPAAQLLGERQAMNTDAYRSSEGASEEEACTGRMGWLVAIGGEEEAGQHLTTRSAS